MKTTREHTLVRYGDIEIGVYYAGWCDEAGGEWLRGTAAIIPTGMSVQIGCWADTDDDQVWSAKEEAERVLGSHLRRERIPPGTPDPFGGRMSDIVGEEDLRDLGTALCAALRAAAEPE